MLVLVNPNARNGKESIEPIFDRMRDAGLQLEIRSSLAPEALSKAIIDSKVAVDGVVIGGGDGTINSAAEGLIETQLPLGILPMGTANDLARTLGIPPQLDAAADIIISGRTKIIDVGTVNGHAFFNVASLGLSSEVARGLTRESKRRWGRLGYAVAACRAMASARPFTAWISNDEERVRVTTLQIAVGNGRHYGGGNVIEESAAIDDGYLDLYSLELKSLIQLARMLPAFRKGAHGAWNEVRTKRSAVFAIETRRPRPINADGELVTTTPAHFHVHRKAVTVFVPG